MVRIILIRHGQTEWNRIERFRGRVDLPLDDVGLRQAEAVGRRMALEWELAAVYASPLARAVQTAEAIATACDLAVQPLPGVIDIDYGEWQGLSPQEVSERYPELYRAWLAAPQTVHIPGGESLDDVRCRGMAALDEVISGNPGRTIALVSHTVVNRVLLLSILGLDNSRFWSIRQETAAINTIEWEEDVFTLVSLNDTCHLRAGRGMGT